MTKYRKRSFALAWLVFCLYGAAFLGSYWADASDEGKAVATADDIQCSRNWFLLGTRWSCSATVTDADGAQYRFTSDSSLLTPADIGTEVAMEKFTSKKSPPTFTTARAEFAPMPWNLVGTLAFIALGIAGLVVLWPRDRLGWPKTREARLAEARRLRAQWPKNLAIGALGLYGAFFVHGVFVASHIDDNGIVALPTDGTGVVQSCGRDWRYLGAVRRCTVDVTSKTGARTTESITWFTPGDRGEQKPVTLVDGAWEAVDQPYENRFAKAFTVLLLLVGTVVAKPLTNLQMARRLENTAPGRDALNQSFLS
ncbi:DUF6346 domain-containing protein [Lentzea chajnantorensis]